MGEMTGGLIKRQEDGLKSLSAGLEGCKERVTRLVQHRTGLSAYIWGPSRLSALLLWRNRNVDVDVEVNYTCTASGRLSPVFIWIAPEERARRSIQRRLSPYLHSPVFVTTRESDQHTH